MAPHRSKHKGKCPLPSEQLLHLNPSTVQPTHLTQVNHNPPTSSTPGPNPPAQAYSTPLNTSKPPSHPTNPTMLQSPPPPQAVTPDPRRSTRTRKPSTRLVLAVTTASPPHRLHRINGEPLESWPPKPEDLPAALHHLLPKRGRGAKTTGAKKAGKQAAKKALTASRHPGSGTSPSNNSDLKPSSLEPPIVPLWSHRTMGASNVYYHAESAVRDSLAREDEIRAAWVRNEPVRLEQERRWDMEDRVVKRKLGFMVEHFIAREREEEGKGERTDSGHEEEVEEEEEEREREVKKTKRE